MTTDYAALFADGGPLACAIDDFQPRHEQQQLAAAIGRTLDQAGMLAAEAGTGVGKTFAYLAPVLQAGRKVLISTGTRTLQDQIYYRDLAIMRRALGQPVKVALLKGRSNYLCLHRLDLATGDAGGWRNNTHDLAAVNAWARHTLTGDRSELSQVSETSPIWPRVTSTVDNCLGTECPMYSKCWVVKARREAQQADVVVVNHHLLLADMALKEEGFGELLPQVDAVIVDEAHQFPAIAGQYFGEAVSVRQLRELCRDTQAEYLKSAADMPDLLPCLRALETALSQWRLSLGERDRRFDWGECSNVAGFCEQMTAARAALDCLRECLNVLGERSRGLDNCRQRGDSFAARLAKLADGDENHFIRWAETRHHNATFHLTPHDVAPRLAELIHADDKAWVFTSATLAVANRLEHFCSSIGVGDSAEQRVLGSPFDYAHHALLYLPPSMPQPNAPSYTQAVVEAALPLIEANGGRAFLLFTSHRALRAAAAHLKTRCDCALFVQGEAPRTHLIEQFRKADNAVLLGTSSFWQGVDVKGDALSLVVIDRLPFASPGDPVLKARMSALKQAGGRPFPDMQLPQAVIQLKQGAGRLIRDAGDTGVLMLCDPRLTTKSYGKVFLNSLPPMSRTDSLTQAVEFLRR